MKTSLDDGQLTNCVVKKGKNTEINTENCERFHLFKAILTASHQQLNVVPLFLVSLENSILRNDVLRNWESG